MAIRKRKLVNVKGVVPKNINYKLRKNVYYEKGYYSSFYHVNYKIFFSDSRWDKYTGLEMHKLLKIGNLGRFYKRKWLPNTCTKEHWAVKKLRAKFSNEFSEYLLSLWMNDMIERDNKIYFSVYSNKRRKLGDYKIGIFHDNRVKEKDLLIMAIVPHKHEMISALYPVIRAGSIMVKKLKQALSENRIQYENINVQERIAENNRLSGFYRRVSKPSKNKKTDI